MTDPMDFVVGMSMTFEQANLDHCIHYGKLFGDVGDQRTVEILEQATKMKFVICVMDCTVSQMETPKKRISLYTNNVAVADECHGPKG